MKVSRLFHNKNRCAVAAGTLFASLILMAASASAQQGAMSPYQGENDGVSAGGKWMEFRSEDKMTGAKKVRFELLSNNYLREDPDYKPRVELVCSDGKYQRAVFNPGARLGRPDYPGFWGQPKMEVRVRIDGSHDNKGWNWERDRVLSMDKGTVRRRDRGRGVQRRSQNQDGLRDRRVLARRSQSGRGKARLRFDSA